MTIISALIWEGDNTDSYRKGLFDSGKYITIKSVKKGNDTRQNLGTDRKEKGGDHEINVSKNSLIKFSHDKTCKKSAAKYN